MEPIDFRTATWQDLQSRLQGQRLAVLAAWRQHGPGTTREVATRAGIDILTLRPRTTELYQLGLLAIKDPEAAGNEGTYRALSDGEAWDLFHRRHASAGDAQLALKL